MDVQELQREISLKAYGAGMILDAVHTSGRTDVACQEMVKRLREAYVALNQALKWAKKLEAQ